LGASFLGLAGDEVIYCVLDIMYAKAPYTVMQRAMHSHPTVSEFIPTMMGNLKPRTPACGSPKVTGKCRFDGCPLWVRSGHWPPESIHLSARANREGVAAKRDLD